MKKKINKMMILIATVTILLTMVLITVVYYDLFRRQVLEDLKSYGSLLKSCSSVEEIKENGVPVESDLRLTLIGSDGQVLYDNEADSVAMGNHASRPEIQEAMRDGEGEAVRNSETLSQSTFYYAIRLEDGSILRLSKDARSIYSIFSQALPMMVGIFVVLLVLCMVAARVLTTKLVAPIEKLAQNIGECTEMQTYEELTPFMTMIRKQHEDIMKNARMRQEFSANVSHELKTPLTSMKVLADSLVGQQGVPEELYQEFMSDITAEIDRENKIITDLLSLVKMDKKAADVNITHMDINQLLEDILKRLRPIADRRNIDLILDCFRPVDADVDEVKFTLAVSNLVENGIKYNVDDGWVRVSLDADHKYFYITVADSGMGIPEDSIERIFERFYRVDKSHSKEIGGTGLGLAITKSSVAMHHGTIKVFSKEGEGTTFSVRIPLSYIPS